VNEPFAHGLPCGKRVRWISRGRRLTDLTRARVCQPPTAMSCQASPNFFVGYCLTWPVSTTRRQLAASLESPLIYNELQERIAFGIRPIIHWICSDRIFVAVVIDTLEHKAISESSEVMTKLTANSRIALCSSKNAVSISSARTMNRFALPRCASTPTRWLARWASTSQIVRPSRSRAETLPKLQPASVKIVGYDFPVLHCKRFSLIVQNRSRCGQVAYGSVKTSFSQEARWNGARSCAGSGVGINAGTAFGFRWIKSREGTRDALSGSEERIKGTFWTIRALAGTDCDSSIWLKVRVANLPSLLMLTFVSPAFCDHSMLTML